MDEVLAKNLLASEIYDRDPRSSHREGTIAGVNGDRLWVDWFGRHTWVALSRCHANPDRKSGYYVPALRKDVEDP